jgi:hypothetical protein
LLAPVASIQVASSWDLSAHVGVWLQNRQLDQDCPMSDLSIFAALTSLPMLVGFVMGYTLRSYISIAGPLASLNCISLRRKQRKAHLRIEPCRAQSKVAVRQFFELV